MSGRMSGPVPQAGVYAACGSRPAGAAAAGPVARPTFYVAVNRLNLRACPGMDCPKIAVLDRNQEVEKVGDAEDWSQIRIKRDGTIGWVSSRYLSATPVAAAPEAAPPPTPPEAVTPPPLPEKPEKAKPTPRETPGGGKTPQNGQARPSRRKKETPAPEKPLKPQSRKPSQAGETGKPEKAPAPEPPVVKPEKPAKPATPPEKPAPPAAPEPEKPGKIRIM